jgi:uncharacterized protein (UPF0332 family)
MEFQDDLLEQARFLTGRDVRRPKQASLRRAVSTAYYAVFHLLASDAASQASPNSPTGLSQRIQRSLDHTAMKQASKGFASNNLSMAIKSFVAQPLPLLLVSVAGSFNKLQEERHEADYDLASKFDRARAQNAVVRAEQVFRDWAAIRDTDDAKVFLAALMFGKYWDR